MPKLLLTHGDKKLKEVYGDYCLDSILRGEEAKPIEDFQRSRSGVRQ